MLCTQNKSKKHINMPCYIYSQLVKDFNLYYNIGENFLLNSAVKFDEVESIFIPINVDEIHWSLIIFYPLTHKLLYIDSMEKYRFSCDALPIMEQFFKKFYLNNFCMHLKIDKEIDSSSYLQSNGYDCGIFVCANTRALVEGKNWPHPDAMQSVRERMTIHMVNVDKLSQLATPR